MALTFTSPGAKVGTGDALALFLSKFGGEVLRFWPQNFVMDGKYISQTLTEYKETKDRWTGSVNSRDYFRGINLLADTNTVAPPAANAQKFTEFITRLDVPRYSHEIVPDIDMLMSPSGAQDRMRIAEAIAEAIGMAMDLRAISTVIQTASMPHPAVLPTTHPYFTKTLAGTAAGISSTGGTNDAIAGFDVNALLTTTATGSAVEDEMFKVRRYMDYLGIPTEDVYALMTPTYSQAVWKEQGQRVSIGFTTAASTERQPTHGFSPSPAGPAMIRHEGTGMWIVPTRHLFQFGTNVDNAFATTSTGEKYAPGSTMTDTVFGINGFTPANGKFESNQATNPTAWEGAAHNVKDLYDKVRIVFFHRRAIKRNVLQGFMTHAEQRGDLLNDWLIWAKLTCGFGALDPTSAFYSIEAVV